MPATPSPRFVRMILQEIWRRVKDPLSKGRHNHLAKFHKTIDAKAMWGAIKSRFSGNDKSKKMQKYLLKQQFEGFSMSTSEGLHKGYDRDCRAKGNQDSRRRDVGYIGNKTRDNGRRPAYQDDSKALVTINEEDINWSVYVEEDLQNYSMMAYSSSNSGSDNETSANESDSKPSVMLLVNLTLVALKDKGIVDSGCSRYMTGNKAYLADYQEFKGGSVAFGELKHYNLFFMSQMCDKKNKVLFTNTDYLVLSPDFKLPDENQVLLKIPRQHNMYNFNLKNIDPSGDLACLFAKA
nr:ribonuclease H-like domain-containing protein [Tanacetum cinerariifolium]